MNIKSKLISVLALIGVISCSSVYATEITSVFSGERLSRDTLKTIATTNEFDTNVIAKTLGITSSNYKTNNGEIYWKIVDTSEGGNSEDLYCLNLSKGFGAPNGSVYESEENLVDSNGNKIAIKEYKTKYNLSTMTEVEYQNYTGLSSANKNKVLAILNNALTSKEDMKTILIAASEKVEEAGWTSYVKEDMKKNNDSRTSLTFEDIKIVQQIAIWHYTNPGSVFENTIGGICDSEGRQISSQGENILINTDTYYNYMRSGLIKQAKLNALYNYFIDVAEKGSTTTQAPSLSLLNTNATIIESGENYLVGPFSLQATNKELIKNITANVNVDYILLNSSKEAITNNDFSKVLGSEFYLKIEKSKISNKTDIQIELTGLYNHKEITLLTNANDPMNTQPVVLIENEEETISTTIEISIELESLVVEKVWEDDKNVDGVRPESVKVQLYKDGLEYGNVIKLDKSNNWKHTWEKLVDGQYTVKELNNSNTPIEEGKNYNADYTVSYKKEDNKIIVTNKHIPEITQKTVTKIWEDGNNADGIRPEEITVELYKINNGQEETIETKKLNNSNNWTYTWNQLPKKANGENIVYGIKEITSIDGYETKYSAEDYSNVDLITITNTHISKDLAIQIQKVDEQGKIITSSEAEFEIKGAQDLTSKTNKGILDLNAQKLVGLEFSFDYIIKELLAPSGYNGLSEEISVKISGTTKLENESYLVDNINITDKDGKKLDNTKILAEYNNEKNVVTIKVKNKQIITGKYNVVLRKIDENGNKLVGSKFKVSGTEYDLSTGEVIVYENQQISSEDSIELMYMIEETVVPAGYNGIETTEVNIKAQVEKIDNNYKLTKAELVDGEGEKINNENISIKLEGESIVIEVKNTPKKKFDLALRKFITSVNEVKYSREPVVDTSTIATTGTATYKHIKQPIAVQRGDIVTYTIRVYNEGELDGYVDIITDFIPNNLIPIIVGNDDIDQEKYADEIEFNLNWGWIMSEDGKSVTTTKTSKVNSEIYSEEDSDTKLEAYVEGSDKLDYIDVQIKCLVADSAVSGEFLTNIAEITKMCDVNGIEVEKDRDSDKANAEINDINNYKNDEAINSTTDSYVKGQEDDDDFEKLVVKEFDLSLRKFIVKVNETNYSREPIVDTSKLGTIVNGKTITNATYNHSKNPVIVKTNDIVTYTIRIYNEGTLNGFANEITDNIPEGLEFMPNSDINLSYNWIMLDKEGKQTEDIEKAVIITTDYLSDDTKSNVIEARTEIDGVKKLNYKDVQVQFKVVAEPENLKDNIIINEAQISEDTDRDIDSTPNRNEKYDYTTANNEDDIDYEPIKLQYFDLALRKFVTKVNEVNYNNRYPEVIYNEDGSITYKHTKEPVLVTTGDTVVYTIRVYNEGEKAGYATEIKDNLPEGLAFDPNNELNKKYGWKMLDSDGNVTDKAEKVAAFSTEYLKDELIVPLVKENGSKVLSYKDVQIAFIVTETELSDKILVNIAQISKDSDDDIDSNPNNNVESEDDTDKEYVRVQYFDLSLKKWVKEVKVTVDGKTTTTKTNYKEDSDSIAKVDIIASKLKKTTVKFVYSIKVTNEGELSGYAYEIKDYIPNGLKFVAEDNKDWKQLKDGAVVTDKLKDTLLNPGESATVEIVLTWKNSSTNLGLKTNYAEISSDSANDIDSIPDNYDFTEDDIDDAQVILSIKTAGATTYIGLIFTTVAILAVGVILIKKYVLN